MKKAATLITAAALLLGAAQIAIARSRTDRPDNTAEKTASQIFDEEAAQIAQIKAKLRLSPEQEKSWADLEAALRDIAKKRADRLVIIRNALAQPKGPVDLVEQWRNIADILNDRSIELKTLADAAQPLYSSSTMSRKSNSRSKFSASKPAPPRTA